MPGRNSNPLQHGKNRLFYRLKWPGKALGPRAPGMYADIVIYSKGNASGFTVPKSCLVTSTERKYVLVIRSGKVQKVDVTSGNESGHSVEVFGILIKTDSVIVNASDEIIEGKF
jgi:membrane fusion protein, multidrug efflux system